MFEPDLFGGLRNNRVRKTAASISRGQKQSLTGKRAGGFVFGLLCIIATWTAAVRSGVIGAGRPAWPPGRVAAAREHAAAGGGPFRPGVSGLYPVGAGAGAAALLLLLLLR